MIRSHVRAILAASAAALVVGSLALAAAIPAVGTKAPTFTLTSQESKQVSLKDFNGKWVVLYFYPKDQTPGCTIEAHNFQEDQPKYTAMNAAIVGVSADSVQSHTEWCTKDNLTFKMLADPDQTVIGAYGSSAGKVAARNTFLIDPQGVIRKAYEVTDTEGFAAQVLTDLSALT